MVCEVSTMYEMIYIRSVFSVAQVTCAARALSFFYPRKRIFCRILLYHLCKLFIANVVIQVSSVCDQMSLACVICYFLSLSVICEGILKLKCKRVIMFDG